MPGIYGQRGDQRRNERRHESGPAVLMLLALVVALLVCAPHAAADSKAVLKQVGTPNGSSGGQLNNSRGLAVNVSGVGAPAGSVYVAEGNPNHRITQFDKDGNFIRTWGYDVIVATRPDSSVPPNSNGTGFEVCDVSKGNVKADCKAGVAGAGAGQQNNPQGIAVDQTNGFVYVTSSTNRRVDVFSPVGQFAGAFGWDVSPTGGAELEVCTIATTCKASGAAGAQAGNLSSLNASSPAIDATAAPGVVYVPDVGNARVSKYATTIEAGELKSVSFIKAFGWDVAPGAVDEEQEVRVVASSGQFTLSFSGDTTPDIPANESAANVETALNALPAISGGGGSVTVTGGPGSTSGAAPYVVRFGGGPLAGTNVAQLIAANGTTPLGGGNPSSKAAVLTRAQGGTTTALESCTQTSSCKAGTSGAGAGQFGPLSTGGPTASAVDSTGSIYVASGPLVSGTCAVATPCRIQKFAPDTASAVDFGPTSEPGQTFFTSGASNTVAALGIAIDPTNDHVFVLRKVSVSQYRVLEYDSTGNYVETHPSLSVPALTGFTNNLGAGIGVGLNELVYSNMGGTNAGEVVILGPLPPAEPKLLTCTGAARAVECSGQVTIPSIESGGVATTYRFEYTADGDSWSRIPASDVALGNVPGVSPVDVQIDHLTANTLYLVRLCATTATTVCTSPKAVKTPTEAPQVVLSFADEITQSSAELGAHVNPGGLKTGYYFEWGATAAYGNRVPATTERDIGSGADVVVAKEPISDLDAQTVYHLRVVATNADGITAGPDVTFETLNSCGLPDGRCFELVSPSDKGPVAGAGDIVGLGGELRFQAAPQGGKIAYEIAYGLPDASAGNEVLYQVSRASEGWPSFQISPPVLETPNSTVASTSSSAKGLSRDLTCGIYSSTQPLTANAPQVAMDAGHANLYRGATDGSWSLITNLEPSVVSSAFFLAEFRLTGMSPDCNRVIFRSDYQYPGLPATGKWRLYKWENGILGTIGRIPGSGPVPAAVVPGGSENPNDDESIELEKDSNNSWNAVSDDARRVYFTAVSLDGDDKGQQAIFLSEDGDVGVDVSQSQAAALPDGAVNNDDSVYELASNDGSEVFFLGRYGLAPNGSGTAADTSKGASSCSGGGKSGDGTGCDLYRYSIATGRLVDLSVPEASVEGDIGIKNRSGASVVGVLGANSDGSHVYFAARGKLIPSEGPLEASNRARDEYSVYLWTAGGVRYVAQIKKQDLFAALVRNSSTFGPWSSQVTPDGDQFLFESRANVTGYQGGAIEAYLYDAPTDSVVCVSCRRDGLPSVAPANVPVLSSLGTVANTLTPAQSLSSDGDRVYFISFNRLATGAVAGKKNLYQWEDGQISFIAGSPAGSGFDLQFAGASESGDDLYFTTLNRLTWADKDGQLDLYDARVGGGFAEPTKPPACDPLTESACQGSPGAGGSATVPPASSALVGAGNVQQTNKKQAKKPKKSKKKSKKKKGKKKKGKKQRYAKKTGRVSK